jgi:C_GCAxxG_C_C family probable redox protein
MKSEAAAEKFRSGYNCAQSVLWAFSDEFGMDSDVLLRIACGFGGGIARRQEICGAVSGGIMALGLKYGQGEGKDRPYTENTYVKAQEFIKRFEAIHGTCNCKQLLLDNDLTTPEGKKNIEENNLREKVCKCCVRTAVEIVEDMV